MRRRITVISMLIVAGGLFLSPAPSFADTEDGSAPADASQTVVDARAALLAAETAYTDAASKARSVCSPTVETDTRQAVAKAVADAKARGVKGKALRSVAKAAAEAARGPECSVALLDLRSARSNTQTAYNTLRAALDAGHDTETTTGRPLPAQTAES